MTSTSKKTKRRTIELYANPNCGYCHGSGTVYDSVPYGSYNVSMPSMCDCVFESCTEEELELIDAGELDYVVVPGGDDRW